MRGNSTGDFSSNHATAEDGSIEEDSIPAPAKEEYLQMRRTVAHLPQLEKHKQEKAWLDHWRKTHSPPPLPSTKRRPKALRNTADVDSNGVGNGSGGDGGLYDRTSPRTPNLSPRGLEMTPWE